MGAHDRRVLVLLASTNRRGAEIEGERLTRELRAAGIDADVAALAPGTAPTLDVSVLGGRPLAMSTLRALRRQSRGVDVVVAYGSSTLPACALGLMGTGTPFVYRSIGDPRAWVRGGLHRRRTGWMMRRAERVVALWPQARDALADLYAVDPAKIDVVPNARSREEYSPATPSQRREARATLGIPSDVHVVSLIGSLTDEKRPGLAIEAVALVPEAHLLMVGDGPLREIAEQSARDLLGARAHVLGAVESLADVYAASDVVLSTSSTEGMSGVLIEAGMCGLVVCATDVGATSWLFEQGLCGTMVGADWSPASIARAISGAMALTRHSGSLPCAWADAIPRWSKVVERAVPHASG